MILAKKVNDAPVRQRFMAVQSALVAPDHSH